MPRGKDSYQALPGAENLTWVDQLRAALKSDMLQTNPQTGVVENPRREYMKERIKARIKDEQGG